MNLGKSHSKGARVSRSVYSRWNVEACACEGWYVAVKTDDRVELDVVGGKPTEIRRFRAGQ